MILCMNRLDGIVEGRLLFIFDFAGLPESFGRLSCLLRAHFEGIKSVIKCLLLPTSALIIGHRRVIFLTEALLVIGDLDVQEDCLLQGGSHHVILLIRGGYTLIQSLLSAV